MERSKRNPGPLTGPGRIRLKTTSRYNGVESGSFTGCIWCKVIAGHCKLCPAFQQRCDDGRFTPECCSPTLKLTNSISVVEVKEVLVNKVPIEHAVVGERVTLNILTDKLY